MSEIVVNFTDIQKTLEPIFGGKTVKIVLEGSEAVISAEKPAKKVLKARGIFNDCADITMIPGEKSAWERAVVERYAKNNNS
jgi:hypothetical protein